jgi:hypothetical protein
MTTPFSSIAPALVIVTVVEDNFFYLIFLAKTICLKLCADRFPKLVFTIHVGPSQFSTPSVQHGHFLPPNLFKECTTLMM